MYRVKLDCVPSTEGFCSAPLRSCDIRDKVRNGILALFRDQLYFSTTKQCRTKSFGTHVHNTSNNTSTKLQLQRIKLHIEIVNLIPVTPTTILLLTIVMPITVMVMAGVLTQEYSVGRRVGILIEVVNYLNYNTLE